MSLLTVKMVGARSLVARERVSSGVRGVGVIRERGLSLGLSVDSDGFRMNSGGMMAIHGIDVGSLRSTHLKPTPSWTGLGHSIIELPSTFRPFRFLAAHKAIDPVPESNDLREIGLSLIYGAMFIVPSLVFGMNSIFNLDMSFGEMALTSIALIPVANVLMHWLYNNVAYIFGLAPLSFYDDRGVMIARLEGAGSADEIVGIVEEYLGKAEDKRDRLGYIAAVSRTLEQGHYHGKINVASWVEALPRLIAICHRETDHVSFAGLSEQEYLQHGDVHNNLSGIVIGVLRIERERLRDGVVNREFSKVVADAIFLDGSKRNMHYLLAAIDLDKEDSKLHATLVVSQLARAAIRYALLGYSDEALVAISLIEEVGRRIYSEEDPVKLVYDLKLSSVLGKCDSGAADYVLLLKMFRGSTPEQKHEGDYIYAPALMTAYANLLEQHIVVLSGEDRHLFQETIVSNRKAAERFNTWRHLLGLGTPEVLEASQSLRALKAFVARKRAEQGAVSAD